MSFWRKKKTQPEPPPEDGKYYYSFCYETPIQRKDNELHGWKNKDSKGFFIRASSKEKALEWGDEIAYKYLKVMHNKSDIARQILHNGGLIIEESDEVQAAKKRNLPVINYYEMPDIEEMIKNDYPNMVFSKEDLISLGLWPEDGVEYYHYSFAYETPQQSKDNKIYDWDDMNNSIGFYIRANSQWEALAWGDKLASEYVKVLYNDPEITLEDLEWGGGRIEQDEPIVKAEYFKEWLLKTVKTGSNIHNRNRIVSVNEMIDVKEMVHNNYGPEPWITT